MPHCKCKNSCFICKDKADIKKKKPRVETIQRDRKPSKDVKSKLPVNYNHFVMSRRY